MQIPMPTFDDISAFLGVPPPVEPVEDVKPSSYLSELKSKLTPAQYDALIAPLMYTANEAFGGKVQDYQAQLLMPLDTSKFKNLNIKDLYEPDYYVTDDDGSTRKVSGQFKSDTAPVRAMESDEDTGKVTKWQSSTPIDVNGVPVFVNYDSSGKPVGYEGDPRTTSWINGKQRIIGNWDAKGMPKPTTSTSSGGGFFKGIFNDVMSDPILGTAANIAAAYFGGPLGTAALGVAQGKDLEDIAKNAALSYAGGQIASGVGGATGSTAAGQIAGGTASGLLSGQDLGTALTNAAINTGANQAAGGLMNAVNAPTATDASMTFTPSAPLDFGDTPVDYGQTGTGGLGLKADLAPLDMSNPYSFDLNSALTGGLGLKADLAPLDYSNLYGLNTNAGNLDSMGGGTGIQVPPAEGATLGSIGAAAETPSQNPNLVGSAATGLLSNYLKSLFTGSPSTGSTGTGNMATTPPNSNFNFSSLFGGGLTSAGGLIQDERNAEAARKQAEELRTAGTRASNAAMFRPVGTTTTFGTSNFQVDPMTGQLTGAGYSLSPELKAYQDSIMGGGRASLNDAANISNLGRGYIAESPEAAAQKYMANQLALLAPSRDMESARLANQLQQTGRTGVAVAQGGTLGMANPEQQALANARSMQDLNLAARAQQEGRDQTTFGRGLLTGAYDPFNAGIKTAAGVESLGRQPFDISTELAKLASASGANAGRLGLTADMSAADAVLGANKNSRTASVLGGLGNSSLFNNALGGAFGNTSVGSSLAKYLGGLVGGSGFNDSTGFAGGGSGIVTLDDGTTVNLADYFKPQFESDINTSGFDNYNLGIPDTYSHEYDNRGFYESLTDEEKQRYGI